MSQEISMSDLVGNWQSAEEGYPASIVVSESADGFEVKLGYYLAKNGGGGRNDGPVPLKVVSQTADALVVQMYTTDGQEGPTLSLRKEQGFVLGESELDGPDKLG
ncbi:MAG: hypothetical protein ABIH23_14965 [bacterium]